MPPILPLSKLEFSSREVLAREKEAADGSLHQFPFDEDANTCNNLKLLTPRFAL
jgi:hypothetical protein